ncbi:hypothetical protein PVK06_021326 [Gossypium arboreum]|uniref:G-type lectin S-receptor-like serine/threonine-protein kinase At1g67520 n=1 Tax=Gossypium arboreum TaxID=29729 RepID=A0ABR0PPP5_GOSAR|nr:hypothetical protein PVK06_021326 [Gossypium arboreum]
MFSFRVVVLILGCLWLTEAERGTLNPGTLTSNNHSIWLANRDNLIADDSGVLVLDDTGLKITRTGGNPIQVFSLQSTSITINTSDMKVVLQDSGNLVLQGTNEENRENVVLWQSFDHPTDSFLPVMKLGVSHGRNFSLTSWFSDSIPASRSFTMEWDPARNRLVVRLRERILWTNGEDFENIGPSDPFNMNYDFTNVSNPNWKVENLDMDFNLSSNRSNDHKEYLLDLMTSEDASDVSELQTGNNGRNLIIYTAGLIMSAKNGFSPDNLLGKAIEGITRGLLYLHKYSRLRIIHRDLKLSNILLDENMNPKISDFGLAKIYITNAAGSNTKQVVGRYYMSPEYAMEGIFSEKSDDYSFRVMVLEVVSGQKNSNHFEFDRPLNLVGYA